MEQISYKKNLYSQSNGAIVKDICKSLKQMRLSKNITQEELAKKSGINRITIARMEAGKAINLLTMIQVLRALEKLELINNFDIEPEISPIMLMEAQAKYTRKKASPKPKK